MRNKELRIENCAKCNSRCTICSYSYMRRMKDVISQEHFEKLVDQGINLGVDTVSVFGFGEPYIDPMLEDKIAYCSERELMTFVTTNASILSEDRAHKTLRAGLTHIRFSVHGLHDTYEKVHKGLKWKRTIENIDNFIRLNRDEYDNACQTSVSVIPMHGESIDEIRNFWEPNIGFLEIWRPHNWASTKKFRKLKDERKMTCGRPHNGPVQILADGRMIVCCFDYDAKMVVGDTYFDTIENILKGERFNAIRKAHECYDKTGLLCENCDQLQDEDESPLLYSNRDETCEVGKTSSTKYKL